MKNEKGQEIKKRIKINITHKGKHFSGVIITRTIVKVKITRTIVEVKITRTIVEVKTIQII